MIDVGSTIDVGAFMRDMVQAVLASTGSMNPQIRFGEDHSRVSYRFMNPGGAADMTKAVIDGVQGLIDGAAAAAGIDVADVEMVL